MTEEDLYKICEICEKRFAKSYMAEHIKSHNDAFRCKICQKTFSCGSNLRKHTKKHRPGYKPKKQVWNAKKIKCGQCDKILRGSNALKVCSFMILFYHQSRAAGVGSTAFHFMILPVFLILYFIVPIIV